MIKFIFTLPLLFIGCGGVKKVKVSENYSQDIKYEKIEIEPSSDDKIFIREYEYSASEDDSKNSSRKKAITQLKTLLSEEVGTHIESYLEIQKKSVNGVAYKSINSEIQSLSSAITKLEVLDEKWDGKKYWIKASVRINEQRTVEILLQAIKSKANEKDVKRLNRILEKQSRKLVAQEIINEARKNEVLRMKIELVKYQKEELEKIDESKLSKIEKIKLRIKRERIAKQEFSEKVCSLEVGFTKNDVEEVVGKPDKIINDGWSINSITMDTKWVFNSIDVYFKDKDIVYIQGCDELKKEIEQDRAILKMKYYENELLKEAEKEAYKISLSPNDTNMKWVQPANKKEECKVYVGFGEQDPTLDPNYKLFWDGECKNGFAYGLGREIERGKFRNMWQLGFYENGKAQKYCIAKYPDGSYWEGDCSYDENIDQYGITTELEWQDGNLSDVIYSYKKRFSKSNPIQLSHSFSPFWNGSKILTKEYIGFTYRYTNNWDNPTQKQNYIFEVLNNENDNHGWTLVQTKENNQTYLREWNNGIAGTFVAPQNIPQEFYKNADEVINEINKAAKKAEFSYKKAKKIKDAYQQRICKKDVKVSWIKDEDYKLVCYEDALIGDLVQKKLKGDKKSE